MMVGALAIILDHDNELKENWIPENLVKLPYQPCPAYIQNYVKGK
jgi:hypothetical protein